MDRPRRNDRSTEDPMAVVAQLMRWLLARGKTPVVKPGQLCTVLALTGQILERMDIQPEYTSATMEHVHPCAMQQGPVAGDIDDRAEPHRLPHEFSSAEWDAFREALRLGQFDAF